MQLGFQSCNLFSVLSAVNDLNEVQPITFGTKEVFQTSFDGQARMISAIK